MFKNKSNQELGADEEGAAAQDGDMLMQSNSQERLGQGAGPRGSPSLKKAFKAKNVDEQIVPAHGLSQPIDFNTVNEENY